jgi:hypothetical protein
MSVLMAGAFGSTALIVFRPPPTLRQKAAHIVIGAAMALFVGPAVIEHWFTGSGIDMRRGIAFVIGMLGPLAAEIAIRTIERRGDAVADRLVDRIAGSEDTKS